MKTMLGLLALAGGDCAEAVVADSTAAARVTAVASKLSLFIGRLLYRRFDLSSLHTPLAEPGNAPDSARPTACRSSLEIDRDLLDLAREPEWRLVGEIHGRTRVQAEVKSLAKRYLDRDGVRQPAFGDFTSVHRHGHARILAEFAGLAVVGKINLELYLAPRQRLSAREREAVEREIVVDERRFAVANIEAVAADQSAVGCDHSFCAGLGHFDVGGQCPRLVEDARSGLVGQRDLAGIVGKRLAVPGEARPPHQFGVQSLDSPPVQRQDIVLCRLRPPQVLELSQFLRIFRREIIGLR